MLTDAQWDKVKGFCPNLAYNSANRLDSRRFLDVVLHLARTGERWRDLPASLGNSMSMLARFVIWNQSGWWPNIARALKTDEEWWPVLWPKPTKRAPASVLRRTLTDEQWKFVSRSLPKLALRCKWDIREFIDTVLFQAANGKYVTDSVKLGFFCQRYFRWSLKYDDFWERLIEASNTEPVLAGIFDGGQLPTEANVLHRALFQYPCREGGGKMQRAA
jgi:transposase